MSAHLLLAHFPMALVLVGAAADVIGMATRSDPLRRGAGTLLIIGAATAMLAFVTGSGAMSTALSSPHADHARIEAHSQWAGAAIWPLVGGGVLRALWWKRLHGIHGWATLLAGAISAVLMFAVGASGTAISHP